MTPDSSSDREPANGHCVLRIYVGANRRYEHLSLAEWLVRKAREQRLAGATVLSGGPGYGRASLADRSGLERISDDATQIVEIIDSRERVELFVQLIEKAVSHLLMTVYPVELL